MHRKGESFQAEGALYNKRLMHTLDEEGFDLLHHMHSKKANNFFMHGLNAEYWPFKEHKTQLFLSEQLAVSICPQKDQGNRKEKENSQYSTSDVQNRV